MSVKQFLSNTFDSKHKFLIKNHNSDVIEIQIKKDEDKCNLIFVLKYITQK